MTNTLFFFIIINIGLIIMLATGITLEQNARSYSESKNDCLNIKRLGKVLKYLAILLFLVSAISFLHDVPKEEIGLDSTGKWYPSGIYFVSPFENIINIPLSGSIVISSRIGSNDLTIEEETFLARGGRFPAYT